MQSYVVHLSCWNVAGIGGLLTDHLIRIIAEALGVTVPSWREPRLIEQSLLGYSYLRGPKSCYFYAARASSNGEVQLGVKGAQNPTPGNAGG